MNDALDTPVPKNPWRLTNDRHHPLGLRRRLDLKCLGSDDQLKSTPHRSEGIEADD
jgi:hypothetical protein